MQEGRYSSDQIAEFVQTALRDSFCVLRGHFPRAKFDAWREAFAPLLDEHVRREGHLQNRGANRYYVTLPFVPPFGDPEVYEDPDVLAVVEGLVGANPVMGQLASDTPLLGSDYQEVHRDAQPLFPEWDRETPPFQLAVNFPLVDITPENGPFEVMRGTHMLRRDEATNLLKTGGVRFEQVLLSVGDVMIRDVRHLHRGTPNRTDQPRTMIVIGYSRNWLHRPEVAIKVPRAALAGLSARGRQLLRTNPVVDSLDQAAGEEKYQAFAY